MLAVAHPLGLSNGPGARFDAGQAGLERTHIAFPAAGDELVFLSGLDDAKAFAALVLLARGGRGFGLEIGHNESSPAVHRQAGRWKRGYLRRWKSVQRTITV
ncbi:hypothetical protein D3C75_1182990 [compost metagenome]